MTIAALQRDSLLLQDNTRETRQRCSRKIAAIRRALIHLYGLQCHYCDEHVTKAEITVDHIVPWSICHITAMWNSALVCRTCNEMKGNEIDWCICEKCHAAVARWREMQEAS